MKTKAKAALIAGAAIAGVAGGLCIAWCSGINYERRYKKLFDKTFKGDYKITVTESGYYTEENLPLKLPVKYKVYDVEYKDKNGNTRNITFDSRYPYYYYNKEDYSDYETLFEYIKNRNIKADRDVALALHNEIYLIVSNDAFNDLLPKYFDDAEPDDSMTIRAEGDGYRIFMNPIDFSYDYIDQYHNNDDKMLEFISPETCPVLSDIDWRSAADIKTYSLNLSVSINDESKYDMMDEFAEKAEALCKEYSEASDYGGNYMCIVGTVKEDGDETKTIDHKAIYVINGEEVTYDLDTGKARRKFRDTIVEKYGYDTTWKQR
ncbi:hypothetical protein [Ruminococcus albus]|uniref:Uncharacterized protein n=1 Tax=Ruminococcus albus TaxID=1264 RepID=A0A1I1J0P2_RUMAL|nr:hypothetical protein [Ruminococcus albus]SFC42139.1 hypothetical protein SAMN02910406_01697 [Ruminococcus albus]